MDTVTIKRYAVDGDGEAFSEEVVWQPAEPGHDRVVDVEDLPFGPDPSPKRRRMDGLEPGGYTQEWIWVRAVGLLVDGTPANPYAEPLRPGLSIVTEVKFNEAVLTRDTECKKAEDKMIEDAEAARVAQEQVRSDARAALAKKLGISVDDLEAVL